MDNAELDKQADDTITMLALRLRPQEDSQRLTAQVATDNGMKRLLRSVYFEGRRAGLEDSRRIDEEVRSAR